MYVVAVPMHGMLFCSANVVRRLRTLAGLVALCSLVAATRATAETVDANEYESSKSTVTSWVYLCVADTVLLLLAALFAGLTLALLGLDTLSLEIIADSGSEPDKGYARKILPIRQLGNQLLCTLILGNVMVNTLIAQITDSHIHGWIATIVSTALTTLGGEVIPQAFMSAHALLVGSRSAPVVKFFIILLYPVCKPLSMILDQIIGKDPGQIYERNELKKLMMLHASRSAQSGIGEGEVHLMVGAMQLHEKTVRDVMTPINEVLMLEANEQLNEETIQLISERGHSRIPVYETNKNNIIGVLFAKDLLMVNPQECTKVYLLVKFYNRLCHLVSADTKLISMLKYFQTGKTHIALVQEVQQRSYGDPYYQITGLVTMEDIIEELIQSKIFDEHDTDPHSMQHGRGSSGQAVHASASGLPWKRQIGLTARCSRRIHLNDNELRASALFLSEVLPNLNVKDINVIMECIVTYGALYRVRAPRDARGLDHDDKQNVWMYNDSVPSSVFTLVISGRVEVFAGKEHIRLEMSSWSALAIDALITELYVPSFSCRVVQDSTILQITHDAYADMLAAANTWTDPNSTKSSSLTIDAVPP